MPISYQYPLQAAIYHTLASSELEFSTWLHENGYHYLAPSDHRYELGILTGLLARYDAIHGHPFSGTPYCHLQTLGQPKSALVRIKAGTPNETRVRGYRFHFKIDLPEELMQIAYESGLGEKGSMGFGMIGEHRNERR